MDTTPKPTRRQLQAQETKRRLFSAAIRLLEERDYDQITIRDIVSLAGVSVGTFYLYFPSKLDVFYETYREADSYFEEKISPRLNLPTARENILLFFDCYARYNADVGGMKLSKLLYQPDNRYFSRQGEHGIPAVLTRAIEKGQASRELQRDVPAREICDFMMIAARGLVYNWCTRDAGYDLPKAMARYAPRLLAAFLEPED